MTKAGPGGVQGLFDFSAKPRIVVIVGELGIAFVFGRSVHFVGFSRLG